MSDAEAVEVIVKLATTGEHLATVEVKSSSTVYDLRRTLPETCVGQPGLQIDLVLDTVVLEDVMLLSETGIRSGDVVMLTRRMPDIEVWHLKSWETRNRRDDMLELKKVTVSVASAREVMQAVLDSETVGQLVEIGYEHIRVFDLDELVFAGNDDWLDVSGAGLDEVNGKYVRDGIHAGQPRWRRHGWIIPERGGMQSTWLRIGSDLNWCIVNNSDGEMPLEQKHFFYNSGDFSKWRTDTDGKDPGPAVAHSRQPVPRSFYSFTSPKPASMRERLFDYIGENKRALVVVPMPAGEARVVAIHAQHFHNETRLYAKEGRVTENSFGGLDDECISVYDGNIESGPSVWRYLGK